MALNGFFEKVLPRVSYSIISQGYFLRFFGGRYSTFSLAAYQYKLPASWVVF